MLLLSPGDLWLIFSFFSCGDGAADCSWGTPVVRVAWALIWLPVLAAAGYCPVLSGYCVPELKRNSLLQSKPL